MLWRCCPNRLVAASMPLAPLAFAKQSPPVLGDEDSALQDQTFSIVTTTPHFFEPWNSSLRRSTCPGEYESECVWAVGYGSFASRISRGDFVQGCYVLFLNYCVYLVE